MFGCLIVLFFHKVGEQWFQSCGLDEAVTAWAAVLAAEGVVEEAESARSTHFAFAEHD